ncbi:MAG: hypothetical protein RQ783_09705 [Gammaproteobacteria bacterium]|nr:hypothetical protein [Gammaproteobacteria bacterium]
MTIIFDWVKSKPKTQNASNKPLDEMYISVTNSGKQANGDARKSLAVVIPLKMMRDARFVIGDRIEVGFAINSELGRCVAIKRVLAGGHTLSPASIHAGKGATKKAQGSVMRSRVKITYQDDEFRGFTTAKGGYMIDDEGMLIAWEGSLNG